MKIFSIPNYQINNRVQDSRIASVSFMPRLKAPLKTDVVSFGMAPHNIGDILEHQLSNPSNISRMQRLATTYLDIIESVAIKLKKFGVDFDRAYCEKSPIKSPKAIVSKVKRSGSFNVPDRIRATLYCKNAYDLTILRDKILPEFEQRGFVPAIIEKPLDPTIPTDHVPTKEEIKKGVVAAKDIDIRFNRDDIKKVVSEYASYISKPQNSGYEDIQLRFVRDYDPKANPMKHELIILFGKNYSKAKHYESEKIYKHVRMLDELNFYKSTKSEDIKNKTKRYIELIKSILTLEISKKIFESAKNADVYNIDNNLLIALSEQDIAQIKKYFTALRAEGKKYYDTVENRVKSRMQPEAYKKRLATIKKEREKDSKKISQIQKDILESVEFFNKIKYFKNLPEIE